jgi:hypothetical protein
MCMGTWVWLTKHPSDTLWPFRELNCWNLHDCHSTGTRELGWHVKIGSYIYNKGCVSGCSLCTHHHTIARIPTKFGMIAQDPLAEILHRTRQIFWKPLKRILWFLLDTILPIVLRLFLVRLNFEKKKDSHLWLSVVGFWDIWSSLFQTWMRVFKNSKRLWLAL